MSETIRQSELRNNRRVRRRPPLVAAAALDEAVAAAGPAPDPVEWARDLAEGEVVFGDDRPADPWGPA